MILVPEYLRDTVWEGVQQFLETRGETPSIHFAQQGTCFLENVKPLMPLAKKSRAFIAATPNVEWLAFGLEHSARCGA